MLIYHTHVPVHHNGNGLMAPRFLANEVNALNKEVKELILVLYSAVGDEINECKTTIDAEIKYKILAPHFSVPRRLFLGPKHLFQLFKIADRNTIFLIKGPTPLLLYFFIFQWKFKVCIFLVGDYTQNLSNLNFGPLKNSAIKILSHMVDLSIRYLYGRASLMVNSKGLLDKYSKYFKRTELIKTSTIKTGDISYHKSHSDGSFSILFVGRVDYAKGVYELIEAFELCYKQGLVNKLMIVGPIVKNGLNVMQKADNTFGKMDFYNHVEFVGPVFDHELLMEYYRKADILVLASRSEGFPRVFWEAFAAGIPVISTKVGGIPYVLTNNLNAILIEESSSSAISIAIKSLHSDKLLFEKIVVNARELALSNTIDVQIKNMVKFIYNV